MIRFKAVQQPSALVEPYIRRVTYAQRSHIARAGSVIALLAIATSQVAAAQNTPTVRGTVQDAASSRPIIGAIVTIAGAAGVQSTRTDETGRFVLPVKSPSSSWLMVKQIGYRPYDEMLETDLSQPVVIRLVQIEVLDTIRVRANTQAIFGVVATSADLKPLRGVPVQILGTSVGEVRTDSAGRFYYEVKTAGAYMVRARVKGLGAQSISVTVRPRNSVEVAMLIDSADVGASNVLEMAFGDFRERMLRHGLASTIVPRTELIDSPHRGTIPKLMMSRSFVTKGLRLSDNACLFVDGAPRPGLSANAIDPETIEAVELYAANAERSGTLATRWPRNQPCGDTGLPRAHEARSSDPMGRRQANTEVVRWIVVWLKH